MRRPNHQLVVSEAPAKVSDTGSTYTRERQSYVDDDFHQLLSFKILEVADVSLLSHTTSRLAQVLKEHDEQSGPPPHRGSDPTVVRPL